MIRGVLIDLSGVVYVGDKAIPGALPAIERLREAKLPLAFITNTTRQPKNSILARCERIGLSFPSDELFTPSAAARAWLKAHKMRPHLLVHPSLTDDFSDLPPYQAHAVVVGDAGENFTYPALNAAFRMLHTGAPFLALARNRAFLDADNELSLDAGAFVAALEYATQRHAVLLGKPAREFYAAAVSRLGVDLPNVAMIGDDAEADVSGALAAGVGAGLLVRTGKYQDGDESRFKPPPTAVVNDLASAVEWILDRKMR